MNLKKYKLWVLDYDGCLLDSMPYWKTAGSRYIESLGLKVNEGLDDRVTVFTEAYSVRLLREEYKLPGSLEDSFRSVDQFVDTFYPYIPLKEGAKELLDILKKMGCVLVLVSGSSGHIISLNMRENTIRSYFDGVYSVYNHPTISKANGKIFEVIQNRFGVEKKDMIMIDDSLSNILGGIGFGIDAIAVKDIANQKMEAELKKVTLGYYSLKEIVDYFK